MRLSSWLRIILLVWAAFPCLDVLAADKPKPGHVKAMVSWTDGRNQRVPVAAAELGGEEVADYGRARLITVPEAALRGIEQRLRARGLHLSRRDDFDVLSLPGGQIDVRQGLDPGIPIDELIASYPAGRRGLHVLQFSGPVIDTWMRALEGTGATVVMAVPQNGQMILATEAQASEIEALPFVQWISPYHPHHKLKPKKGAAAARRVEVELADFDGNEESLDLLRSFDPSAFERARYANRIAFLAQLTDAAVERLLAEPFVIGVSTQPEYRLSDERQLMAMTSNLDSTGNAPTRPVSYRSWLDNHCGTLCSDLAGDNFWVGIADTGLDTGSSGTRHPELTPSFASGPNRVRYGTNFCSGSHADPFGHGTMVAGIIGGNGGLGSMDSGGYLLGMGVLPTVGIFSTRAIDSSGSCGGADVFDLAADATSNSVFFQNHSYNNPLLSSHGKYTAGCAQFDAAVRDSNGPDTGGAPITLTVSSGNRDGSAGPLTAPAATAKNVIGVGGAENYRTDSTEVSASCRGTQAGGYLFLNSYAKRGTAINNLASDGNSYAWSTYIKPDLTAPASFISSARNQTTGYCAPNFYGQAYTMESGTSFAAPVAAGAAALAARIFSHKTAGIADPDLASPAMIKAMLIASARTMEGGTDRANSATIGPRPNDQQGFGLVSTTELLDGTAKTFVNQTHRFTSSSNPPWAVILHRRDTTQKVKAALVWTDAPAAGGATEPLLNNLDLIVNIPKRAGSPLTPCSVPYWGNNPTSTENTLAMPCTSSFPGAGHDFRNNAELVVVGVDSSSRGVVTVTVDPEQISAQADPAVTGNNQDFALYVYNATQRGDFDHDGKPEIIWRHTGSEERPLLWHDLAGTSSTWLAALPQPWTIVAVSDFDANGSDDYVIHDPSTGEVKIRLMDKTTPISTATVTTLAASWEIAGAGDVDHDGYADIVLRHYGTGADAGKIRLWRMTNTTIEEVKDFTGSSPQTTWRLEGLADLNADGELDFIWHNLSTGASEFWKMQGFSYVGYQSLPTINPSNWRMGGFGDYNGDGYTDILWRLLAGTSANVVWYGNGGTAWTDANVASAGSVWTMAGPR